MKTPWNIGEPVPPDTVADRCRKYGAIWDAVIAADGQWIPVTCQSIGHLRKIQMAATTQRQFFAATRRDGLVLFVRSRGLRKREP